MADPQPLGHKFGKSMVGTLIQKALESLQLVKNNPSQTVQSSWL